MGPQRSRWRCPKRDGPGQIEELAVEIGLRFVNRMSHLATPDAFESRNHSHSTGSEMPRKFLILWDMEQYFKAVRAPFDDQVTMATMYLSGDAKLWWRTRYEDVLEGRCEINAWEELKRELKERSSSCLHGSHESP
uniref:Retrotransposon gag domain-containing protein n=1 Tax=Nelumbo nucifera TaxID=4432 RepID=A0A822XVE3_NELNU|nr:TPA_asm: hypothetical protein HUJ06_027068 [Nelumbo nucifera]